METLRSPNHLGSIGRPLGTERSPLQPPSTGRTSDLFEDEMERAVERNGGDEALEERRTGFHEARRDERHAGFEHYREGARDGRDALSDPRGPRAPAGAEGAHPGPRGSAPPAPAEIHPVGTTEYGSIAPLLATAPSGPAVASAPETGAPALPPPSAAALAAPPGGAPAAQATFVPAAGASAPALGGESTAPVAGGGPVRTGGPAAAPAARPAPPPAPDTTQMEQAAEVLRQLRAQVSSGAQRILVTLSPPELGRIAIEMSLRKGRITALVRAESAQTLELLERQAPELRAMLAQEGIDAERFELQLGSPGDFEGGRTRGHESNLLRPGENSDTEPTLPGDATRSMRPSLLAGEDGIDTYA